MLVLVVESVFLVNTRDRDRTGIGHDTHCAPTGLNSTGVNDAAISRCGGIATDGDEIGSMTAGDRQTLTYGRPTKPRRRVTSDILRQKNQHGQLRTGSHSSTDVH